jgi:hypothetical protein
MVNAQTKLGGGNKNRQPKADQKIQEAPKLHISTDQTIILQQVPVMWSIGKHKPSTVDSQTGGQPQRNTIKSPRQEKGKISQKRHRENNKKGKSPDCKERVNA